MSRDPAPRPTTYIEAVAEEIHRRLPAGVTSPDRDRGLYLLYAVLALTVGERVTREDVHDAWAAWMALQGSSHSALRPFRELPAEEQERDEPFRKAIQEVARMHARQRRG
jgi:hypothetical protein